MYSVVKGNMPKVGDTAVVEASYNPNNPFKWNATRVQVISNQVVQVCNFNFFFQGGQFTRSQILLCLNYDSKM